MELITHIINQGLVKHNFTRNIHAFTRLIDTDDNTVNLSNLQDYSIHYTPDQLKLQEQERVITKLQDQLALVTQQKRKLGENLRELNGSGPQQISQHKNGKHLTKAEVLEIKSLLNQGKLPVHIKSLYHTSQATISAINTGKHPKL